MKIKRPGAYAPGPDMPLKETMKKRHVPDYLYVIEIMSKIKPAI